MRPAAGRWDDFASLLVPRKPGGSGCVCMAYRSSSLDMPGRIAHMRALCASEPGPGVLAYVDGETAGWCSVAPKSTYRALGRPPAPACLVPSAARSPASPWW